MKKCLPVVIIAGILFACLATFEARRRKSKEESFDLNQDIISNYEKVMTEKRTKQEALIIKEGYRCFLLWSSDEYMESKDILSGDDEEL